MKEFTPVVVPNTHKFRNSSLYYFVADSVTSQSKTLSGYRVTTNKSPAYFLIHLPLPEKTISINGQQLTVSEAHLRIDKFYNAQAGQADNNAALSMAHYTERCVDEQGDFYTCHVYFNKTAVEIAQYVQDGKGKSIELSAEDRSAMAENSLQALTLLRTLLQQKTQSCGHSYKALENFFDQFAELQLRLVQQKDDSQLLLQEIFKCAENIEKQTDQYNRYQDIAQERRCKLIQEQVRQLKAASSESVPDTAEQEEIFVPEASAMVVPAGKPKVSQQEKNEQQVAAFEKQYGQLSKKNKSVDWILKRYELRQRVLLFSMVLVIEKQQLDRKQSNVLKKIMDEFPDEKQLIELFKEKVSKDNLKDVKALNGFCQDNMHLLIYWYDYLFTLAQQGNLSRNTGLVLDFLYENNTAYQQAVSSLNYVLFAAEGFGGLQAMSIAALAANCNNIDLLTKLFKQGQDPNAPAISTNKGKVFPLAQVSLSFMPTKSNLDLLIASGAKLDKLSSCSSLDTISQQTIGEDNSTTMINDALVRKSLEHMVDVYARSSSCLETLMNRCFLHYAEEAVINYLIKNSSFFSLVMAFTTLSDANIMRQRYLPSTVNSRLMAVGDQQEADTESEKLISQEPSKYSSVIVYMGAENASDRVFQKKALQVFKQLCPLLSNCLPAEREAVCKQLLALGLREKNQRNAGRYFLAQTLLLYPKPNPTAEEKIQLIQLFFLRSQRNTDARLSSAWYDHEINNLVKYSALSLKIQASKAYQYHCSLQAKKSSLSMNNNMLLQFYSLLAESSGLESNEDNAAKITEITEQEQENIIEAIESDEENEEELNGDVLFTCTLL